MEERQTTTMAALAANRSKPFRLLDLPAEIRNNVYEKVLESQCPYLTWRKDLSCGSAFPRVSKQVRAEFMAAMTLCAPLIVAYVKNFNFSYIVAFLNRLSDLELHSLTRVQSTRKIHIELVFVGVHTRGSGLDEAASKLLRWVDRLEHPTKKGTKIDTSYEVVHYEDSLAYLVNRLKDSKFKTRLELALSVERRRKEIQKVRSAIDQWHRQHPATG